MKIFVSHSTNGNYEEELYIPLQNAESLKDHEFIFPHESDIVIKDVIRDCDLVIAECSDPTFEQGLELGWGNGAYVSTMCFVKAGTTASPLLQQVTETVTEYSSIEDMIAKIKEAADTI